jgi:hypothetical protein
MNNRVVKLTGFGKKPLTQRIARSVLNQTDDTEWGRVQAMAFDRGILDCECTHLMDIVDFNEAAAAFPGTVAEFLDLLEQGRGGFMPRHYR